MRPLFRILVPTLVLSSCSLTGGGANAQPYYGFSQATEAYQEIAAGTDLSFAGGWSQITALDGEQFPVAGNSITFGGNYQLWISDAGFLNIDNDPVSTVFLSALFTGLNQLVPVDANSSLTYQITGASGAKHLVVQWKNYRRADEAADHYVNFQMHLYQASGVMELRYGPADNGGATYTSFNGPNAGYYFANYTSSVVYDRIWLTGTPAAPTQNTSLTPSFLGMNGLPDDGSVYRFTPTWTVGIAASPEASRTLFVPLVDPIAHAVRVRILPGSGTGLLRLIDGSGQVLRSVDYSAAEDVDLGGDLPSAAYVLVLLSRSGEHQVERIALP